MFDIAYNKCSCTTVSYTLNVKVISLLYVEIDLKKCVVQQFASDL